MECIEQSLSAAKWAPMPQLAVPYVWMPLLVVLMARATGTNYSCCGSIAKCIP